MGRQSFETQRLGPKPGFAIFKFWQGTTEIVLRVTVILFSLSVLTASSIMLHVIGTKIPSVVLVDIEDKIKEITNFGYRELVYSSVSIGGVAAGISIATIVAEITMICLRFANIGLVNYKIRIFLSVNSTLSVILFLVLLGNAMAGSYIAALWRNLLNSIFLIRRLGIGTMINIRDTLAATAVTSIITSLLIAFLWAWVICFLKYNWNSKIPQEKRRDRRRNYN